MPPQPNDAQAPTEARSSQLAEQLQGTLTQANQALLDIGRQSATLICGLATAISLLIGLSSFWALWQGLGHWGPVLVPFVNVLVFGYYFRKFRLSRELAPRDASVIVALVFLLQLVGLHFNGPLPLHLGPALIAFVYGVLTLSLARGWALAFMALIAWPLARDQLEVHAAIRLMAADVTLLLLMEIFMRGIARMQSTYADATRSLGQLSAGLLDDNRRLKDSREAAERASRTKSTFLATMSHEIRTPMNAILGMLRLLRNTGLNERQSDYVNKTSSAARSLLGLINDILDFSKIEAGKMQLDPQAFRPATLLHELGDVLESYRGSKPIDLRLDMTSDLPDLVGDALRIRQVLINLGGNAIKFTPQGEVHISIERVAQDEQQLRLRFTVSDQGIGIAPEHQAHIFDGFSQAESSTTRRFGGTGLGLSISRHLVELMGGQLQLHSRPGKGSRFSFELTFPRAQTPAPEQASAAEALQHGAAGQALAGLHLLLVEDNELNQQVAIELLQDMGATVTLARHGREALDLLRQSPAAFHLVLSDVHMPEMDGYTLTQQIRQDPVLRHLPVLAMTANAMPADRERCLQAGMDEHVSKPFEIEALVPVLLRLSLGRPAAAATTRATATVAPMGNDEALFTRLILPEALCEQAHQHGIDAQAGIDRFMGKVGLYQRMTKSFSRMADGLPGQLQAQLAQGRLDEALLALHSLKGLAGTLAAHALAELSAQGEEMLRQGQRPDAAWLDRLARELQDGSRALEALTEAMTDLRPGKAP